MTERDEAILSHIGRNKISIRAVIEKLYFGGRSCDHVLQRLLEQKRIQQRDGIPNGVSYYQLTLSEVRRRGLPQHQAAPPSPTKLRESLSVLWFCAMGPRPLTRTVRKQLKLFGRADGMGKPHCYERVANGETVIYRLYVPGPDTSNERLIRKLAVDVETALAAPTLSSYVHERLYGFGLIVDSAARSERVRELLLRRESPSALTTISVVPSLEGLAASIKALKGEI